MKVNLHLTEGPEAGKTFEISGADTFLVGRTRKAHLRFDLQADRLISRTHFLLVVRPPRVIVTDLDSKNGTYVNDEKIKQVFVSEGDVIRVGKTRIRVEIIEEAQPENTVYRCAVCGRESGLAEGEQAPPKGGKYVCPLCLAAESKKVQPAPEAAEPARPRWRCVSCEKDLSGRANADGLAEELGGSLYVCRECEGLLTKSTIDGRYLGDYQLLSEIGRGAMGVVYKAVHVETRRICAVKMILPDLSMSEHATLLFEREVEVQSKVIHPNLVRVLSRGRSAVNPYFVTEYLSGGDIKNLVSWVYQGPLEPELACRITIQILTGLEVLHKSGFIHRDLKPSNFLLDRPHTDRRFRVKIADYGLAKSYENAGHSMFDYTREGIAAGSYIFIPPEQITNYKYVKPPVDIYAVGVSLYYMLTGKFSVNFDKDESGKGRHPLEVILEDQPVPILNRKPGLPKFLAAVVDKAVVKEVDRRFQTAHQFRDALVKVAVREGWRPSAGAAR